MTKSLNIQVFTSHLQIVKSYGQHFVRERERERQTDSVCLCVCVCVCVCEREREREGFKMKIVSEIIETFL